MASCPGQWAPAGPAWLKQAVIAQEGRRKLSMGWWFARCDNEADPVTRHEPLANRTWEWRSCSHEDSIQPLSPAKLCRWLRERPGKGILVVGDSLSDVFASTFAAAMGPLAGGERTHSQGSKMWPICQVDLHDTDAVCRRGPHCAPTNDTTWLDAPKRLEFVRNDVLDTSTRYGGALLNLRGYSCGDGFHSASILCNAWAPRVGEFDLVVLNAGAHGPGHGVSHAVYERRLRAAASHVQAQARPGAVLLFRNTPFGHPGCDERRYLPPLPSVEAAEAYLSTGNAKGGRTYDWREFKQRNSVAAPIFEAAGFKVLDVYTPTSMRADAHIPKDCLHYCIPGPTLHWVNLAAAAVLDSGHGFGGGSRFTAHS
uniref:Uncharacterized protein n=1 Tax=Haptolina ericina TaxID=156174 RepID=A0A7S3ESN4_9EUKA|mmetsp:Transcript_16102/g.36083  ORF Transcript_16102/g.36083 Transcript_16102/m.36083 type:complete len:369 (+) Transcript_16102:74-1180(+)